MNNLVPIGQFSKFCCITIKALRHYDALGLLKPTTIDEKTGYRYYSLSQAIEAERIRILRSLDMPIDKIRELLQSEDSATMQHHLECHRQRIKQQLHQYQKILSQLESLIQHEKILKYKIATKDIHSQPVLSIRMQTDLKDIEICMSRTLGEMFQYVREIGIPHSVTPVLLYHVMEFQEKDLDIEICVPVPKLIACKGRMKSRVLESALVVYTLHVGPYSNLHNAYQSLIQWLSTHSYESDGPLREVYLVGPDRVQNAIEFRTEIQWPIRIKS